MAVCRDRRKKKAIALLSIYLLLKRRKKGSKRFFWIKPWIARHDEQGAYYNLVRELEVDGTLRNYLRMSKALFDFIVERVTPIIQRTNTNFLLL